MNFLRANYDRINEQLTASLEEPNGWLFFVLREMPPLGNEETAQEMVDFFKGKGFNWGLNVVFQYAERIVTNNRLAETIRQSETFQGRC